MELAHRAADELRSAAELMADAQRVANFGSWEWLVAADEVTWSEQLYRIFGVDPATFDATFEGYLARVHPDDRALARSQIEAAIRERRPYRFQHRIVRPDGAERVLRCHGEPVPSSTGEVERLVGVCQDVSDLARSERERDEADARFRSAFENAPIGIALVDFSVGPGGRMTQVNLALTELVGRSERELVGSPVTDLALSEDADLDFALRERLVAGEIDRFTIEKRSLFDDRLVWLQLNVSALPEGEEGAIHGIVQVQDVTERKRFEEQLRYVADHDSLTGLMNRRRFREEVEARLALQHRYGGEGALLLIDVDRLKELNDTRGHGAGDILLRRVAELLRERMRTTDVVARLAGDEFAVLLPTASEREAAAVGSDLIGRLGREEVEGSAVSISVGVAPFHGAAGDAPPTTEELTAAADAAMYRAKQRGGGVVEVTEIGAPSGDVQSPDAVAPRVADEPPSSSLVARVRAALEADELLLYAQPAIDLRTGSVAHRELLVRMREGGAVLPASEFLAVATQEPGLCAAIDTWVVDQALASLGNGSRGSRLHVNLAGQTLTDEAAIARLTERLGEDRSRAASLGLEVAEASIGRDVERASGTFRALSATGCPLVLDGFTGGFGSFEFLQRLPLDQVKIDGAVVRALLAEDADHGTIRAIVRVAKGTGKTTVAKLVESGALVPILRMHGVDMAQGYELGEPEPLSG